MFGGRKYFVSNDPPRVSCKEAASLKFASVRLIAGDIQAMVSFYEMTTDANAEWRVPVFRRDRAACGSLVTRVTPVELPD